MKLQKVELRRANLRKQKKLEEEEIKKKEFSFTILETGEKETQY